MPTDPMTRTADAPTTTKLSGLTAEQLELKRLELMERQIALQESQAASLATQVDRTAPRENPNYVPRGATLQPNGEQWSETLKAEMYFGPAKLNGSPMTQAEVEAWNQVQPLPLATLTKTDGSTVRGSVDAEVDLHGRITKIWVRFPFAKDSSPQNYPLSRDIALQLAAQAVAKTSAAA